MPLTLEVKDLTKFFGSLHVLDQIALGVTKGEFVSIVGPSGCGKSTLLKIIGGLVKPTSGLVLLDGQSPIQRRKEGYLGFVFQKPVLLPWRKLEENVRLPLEILRNHANSRERINKVLDLLGLSGFQGSYPKQLSGGMQQRAALARVFLYEPSLLLMDEPFGAVDEITRNRLNFRLLKVWEEYQSTVIFVTHSVEEAVLLADRVVVLSPRPARVDDIVRVDLPRPRSAATLDLNDFHELVRCTRNKLKTH
jgi:NitT/TauT family transport system ATP-binding protein